jgi:hypothetical protein
MARLGLATQAVATHAPYAVVHPVLSMYYLIQEKLERDRSNSHGGGGLFGGRRPGSPPRTQASQSRPSSRPPSRPPSPPLPVASAPLPLVVGGAEPFPSIVVDASAAGPAPMPIPGGRERAASMSGSVRSMTDLRTPEIAAASVAGAAGGTAAAGLGGVLAEPSTSPPAAIVVPAASEGVTCAALRRCDCPALIGA